MNNIVCITGATSGIGKACAEVFASHGYNCILIGRRKERLEALSQLLQKAHNVDILIGTVDIKDSDQVSAFFASLPNEWKNINILINNAGMAKGFASIQDVLIEDMHDMIDTNIKGLLYVSKYAIPLLTTNAHVFNIGSFSGKSAPYSGGATYCGTKAAVNYISECMRLEITPTGRCVTCINPGMVDTEFQLVRADGDQSKVDTFLAKRLAGGTLLDPTDIALVIYNTIGKNIPEITYLHKQ